MPTIPFTREPQVRPSGEPLQVQRIPTSGEDFGAGVGRAMQELGGAVSQVGNIAETHAIRFQNIQNQAAVDDAYANKFSPEFRNMYQKYYALQGKDAVDQMPTYIRQMEEMRTRHADDLANTAQKHLFNQVSRRRVEMELDGMARYADNQNKVYRKNTSDSFLKSQRDMAADFYNDEHKFGSAIGAGTAEIDRYGVESGQSAEEVRARTGQFISNLWQDRIRRMAIHDPMGAQSLYDANKGEIEGGAHVQMEHELKGQVYPVQARQIADAVIGDIPASKMDIRAHLKEWSDEAEKRAEALHPGDPMFRDLTLARVNSRVNTVAVAQQGIEKQAAQTLFLGMMTPAKNDRPTDLSQIMSNPELNRAWNQSDSQAKLAAITILDHNARGFDPPMTNEAMIRYHELRGQAINDPAGFQSHKWTSVDLDLLPHHLTLALMNEQTRQDAKSLVTEQKALAIAHAKQVAAPSLRAAGINTNPKAGSKDAKLYDQFVGRLQQSLDSYYDNNKRMPSDSDIRNMTNSLLVQGSVAGTGFLFEDTRRAFQVEGPGFYVPVPKAERETIVKDYARINGHPPTEGEIREVYTRAQLKKKH
jgi:hypothetical protein